MKRWLLVAALALGCSAPPGRGVDYQFTPDAATIEAVEAAIEVWTRNVGEPGRLIVRASNRDDPEGLWGRCIRGEAHVFPDRTWGEKLTRTVLHELAHVELSCSDADHVADRDSLLFPSDTGQSVDEIDRLTMARLNAAR